RELELLLGGRRVDGDVELLADRLAVVVAAELVLPRLQIDREITLAVGVADADDARLDHRPRAQAWGRAVADLVLAGPGRRPAAALGGGRLRGHEALVAGVVELVREGVEVLELDLLPLGDDERDRVGAAAEDLHAERDLGRGRLLRAERGDAE